MYWIEIGLGISAIFFGIYYYLTSTFDYWKSRGVAGPAPLPFFGNLKNVFRGKISFSQYLKIAYDAYRDERLIGIFLRGEPALVIVDPDLIKDVLVKDFAKFMDRGLKTFDKAEPLSQHLVFLEPARWRPLRHKLSPVFTSGKLKKMFYLLLECGDSLEKYLKQLLDRNEIVECRELTAKYTTDVIGHCAFGLQLNALADENCEFRKMGKDVFTPDWKKMLKVRLSNYMPWLYAKMGSVLTDWKMTNFFLNTMRDTVDYRKRNGIVKHDFIDLIMELRDNPDKVGDIELTDTLLTAQLYIFFLAGFETSASTMSNALYELARQQSIQDRLRVEIKSELAKSNGEITYEGIKSMKYLHMVVLETLRIYPPANIVFRRSTDVYTFAGTNLTIPEGTKIMIPVFAIHRDSRIYPKPEIFDPERFTEEAKSARHPMNWLAFGDGPRKCIGARFANYQTRVGLIKILQHYKVQVCDKTQIPYVIDPRNFMLSPIHGIHLKITRVD